MRQKVYHHMQKLDTQPISRPGKEPGREHDPKLKFSTGNGRDFQVELRRRVDAFFQKTGQQQRDCPQMYLKTATIMISLVVLYTLLLTVASGWQAVLLCMLLGLVMAGIGFNIQHDGGHQGYSNRPWVNKLMAMTLDLIGGSSYNWHWKHGVFHHIYANITGHDNDLELGIFGRLTQYQPWLPFHRWQHLYLWLLYGLMPIKWHFYDDFHAVITGKMGNHTYPRPRGIDLAIFIAGKGLFFLLAFGIPLQFYSLGTVLIGYGITVFTLGIVLSVVFQLAHAVEEAAFPMPDPEGGYIENAWTIHQIETTVDFARHNPVVTWLLGGLNFQVEHHLFPKICHVHYPALSVIVEETCREYGVNYTHHQSITAGVVSHWRWLKRMGCPNTELMEASLR
jgi:linoleoyl-CoA desaturase